MRSLWNAYDYLASAVARPATWRRFLSRSVGDEYGITRAQKLRLLRQIHRNASHITSGTNVDEHLMLVERILSLPRELKGDVVECGCFKGSSTTSLSLACKLTGRRLIVCDSFQGLPEVADDDRIHVSLHHRRYETYQKGEYSGTLGEVKENLRQYGALDVCDFVEGYFEDSLPQVAGQFAFIFLDVDLHESLKTCLRYLWPQLEDGGYLYTHEAQQLAFASLFFDRQWWHEQLDCAEPGLVGAGIGLPTGIACGSALGYAMKSSQSVTENAAFTRFCGDPTLAAS
ncbi:MAG: TylF/MycF/NovP-related O-methyltransferase [Phycisphaeraceae bacterium]